MSLSTSYNQMIKRQGLGHGNLPVFANPLMLGDIVKFRPAQSIPIKREYNVFHDLGMSFSDIFTSAELNRPLSLKSSLELKSSSGVSGGVQIKGGSPVEGGQFDASINVGFSQDNSFYLYAPVYVVIGISDRVGFANKVREKAKADKNHQVGITDHIIDKTMVAISPSIFMASQKITTDTKVKADFKSTAEASVDGSFNMTTETSDVQKSTFDGIASLPSTLGQYLQQGTISNGVFAISFSRFGAGSKIIVDPLA